MNNTFCIGSIFSYLFGILVPAIGTLNICWENDPGYGIFVFLLAFVYFPPTTAFLKKISGISIPVTGKIIPGIFKLWTALGVAELFNKTDLMLKG